MGQSEFAAHCPPLCANRLHISQRLRSSFEDNQCCQSLCYKSGFKGMHSRMSNCSEESDGLCFVLLHCCCCARNVSISFAWSCDRRRHVPRTWARLPRYSCNRRSRRRSDMMPVSDHLFSDLATSKPRWAEQIIASLTMRRFDG